MSAGYLCNPLVSGDTANKQAKAVLSKVQKMSSTYNPNFSGHTKEFAAAANMRGLTTWPWTIDDKNVYIDFFMSGYNGLTTNNCTIPAKFVKILSAPEYTAEINEGETYTVKATTLTYERKEADASEKVRVIPLEGDITVNGTELSFPGPGTYTYALEYTHKINSKNSYTLYTRPVSVTVKGGEATDTESVTDTVTEPDATTDGNDQETGAKGVNPAVIIVSAVAAAAVIGGVIVAVVLSKKKKA